MSSANVASHQTHSCVCVHRKTLGSLLRFSTSKSDGAQCGLADVVSRMQPNQKDIYFISADSPEAASSSPFVERLKKKDLEVSVTTVLEPWRKHDRLEELRQIATYCYLFYLIQGLRLLSAWK